MSIAALAAGLPLVGDLAKSVAPLIQPFVDVAAQALGDALKNNTPQPDKGVEFASLEANEKRTLTFAKAS
jgi:hypothetical protein